MASLDETFDAIVRSILKSPQIKDTDGPTEIPDWDSMNYLRLIAELEKQFSLSFTMDEVVESTTIGDLRKIIRSRHNA